MRTRMDSMDEKDRPQLSHIAAAALDRKTVTLSENYVGSTILSNCRAQSPIVDDAMKYPEEDLDAAITLLALSGTYAEKELDAMRQELCPNIALRDLQEKSIVPSAKNHPNARHTTAFSDNSRVENGSNSLRHLPVIIDSGTEAGCDGKSQVNLGQKSKRTRCASDDSDESYQPFEKGVSNGKRTCNTASRIEVSCPQPIRSSVSGASSSRTPLPKSRTILPASKNGGKIGETSHGQDDGGYRDNAQKPKKQSQSLPTSAPQKDKEKGVTKPNLYNNIRLEKVPVGQKYTGPSLAILIGEIFEAHSSRSLALGKIRYKLTVKIANLGKPYGDMPLDQSFRKTVSECCVGKGDNGRPLLKRIDGTDEGKNSNNGLYRLFVDGDEPPVKKGKKNEKN